MTSVHGSNAPIMRAACYAACRRRAADVPQEDYLGDLAPDVLLCSQTNPLPRAVCGPHFPPYVFLGTECADREVADHLFEGEEAVLHVMSFWIDAPEVPHPPPDSDGNSGVPLRSV
jgi:hypothetical protein